MKTAIALLCALLLAPASWAAVSADEKYAAFMGSYIVPDGSRDAAYGWGAHLLFGLPMTRWLAAEINGHGYSQQQDNNSELYDRGLGLGLDLRVGPRARNFAPFIALGAGLQYEEVQLQDNTAAYLNIGTGAVQQLNDRGLALRAEARLYLIFSDQSVPGEDLLGDGRFHIGLQQSFGAPAAAAAPAATPPAPLTPGAPPVQVRPQDSDGDGIGDAVDQCPGTLAGQPVDARGCSLDNDADGVPNSRDACPDTAPGFLVDGRGCVPDSDGDKISDDRDACPNTMEEFAVDARGCAIRQSVILTAINFEANSSRIDFNGKTLLEGLVNTLKGQPGLRLEVSGHTDDQGAQDYNLWLSKRRAEAVRAYLIEQGIAADRLTAEGYGEFKPLADNSTEDGRDTNRRVELKVLDQ